MTLLSNRYTILLTLTLIFISTAKSQSLIFDKNTNTEEIRLILNHMYGGLASEKFERIDYIPLQGGKGNIIERTWTSLYFKDRIVILNEMDGQVLFFDSEGNLIKRISNIPGFKTKIKKLFYRIEKKEKHVIAFGKDIKVEFDLNGKIIDKELGFNFSPNEPKIVLGNNSYLYNPPIRSAQKKEDYALKLNDQVLIRYDHNDSVNIELTNENMLIKSSEEQGFAIFENSYQIFELDKNGIKKRYQFIFPLENSIVKQDYINFRDYKSIQAFISKFPNKIYRFGRPIISGDYIILQIGSSSFAYWIAYNLKTKKTLNLNSILPDSSNYFLEFMDGRILETDGEYLYSIIYPDYAFRAKEKAKEEGYDFSKELMIIEKSENPIIVRFKLK